MAFYIAIEDPIGTTIGSGPITTALNWRIIRRLDRAGAFYFSIAAGDPKAALIQSRRVASIYAQLGPGAVYTYIGGGYIDQIDRSLRADGTAVLQVSGDDLLRSLANRLHTGAYNGATLAAIVAAMMPGDWSTTIATTPPVNSLYSDFQYVTILAGLRKIAERAQSHFYLSGPRAIAFDHIATSSGLRAIRARGDLASGTVAIANLAVAASSFDIATRIYPLGAGNGGAALNLRPLYGLHLDLPIWASISTPDNYIQHDIAAALYGQIDRAVQFRDIRPLSGTAADLTAAATALANAAYYWLDAHSAPALSYKLAIRGCTQLLRPMQTIRVSYRDPSGASAGVNLDADLYILEVTLSGDPQGAQTTDLIVAAAPTWPDGDGSALTTEIEQSKTYAVSPQLNANLHALSYTKAIDQSAVAAFRFRFDAEVLQVNRITFDFQLLQLESTVLSVGAASVTSSAGGGATVTSSSGGSSTPTSSSGGGESVTSSSGGSSTPTSSSGGGESVTSSSGGGTTVTAADGDKSHLHSIPINNGTSGTAVTYSGGQLYSNTGAVRTVNSNFANVVHSHEVTIGSHSHTVTTSNHAHTVTIGSHSHTVTTSNHAHTVTIGSHSHTVTIADHTHNVTPIINTVYGIYRDDSANLFSLADLEYSIDGSNWYQFTVGVNNYESLGGGWHRIDLTGLCSDSNTRRPLADNNALQIRRRSAGATGKRATIDAQLNIRTIIQAIALT